jgi:hypothetical protein
MRLALQVGELCAHLCHDHGIGTRYFRANKIGAGIGWVARRDVNLFALRLLGSGLPER